ncbi:MAG: biotin transporter BioY [Cyanobacteria bacterium P01_H01_bin.121]
MLSPTEFIWALIGLFLTIGGTMVEASIAGPAWIWSQEGIQVHSLHATLQIGAVLLVGCTAGRNAGALSQIAYILLGLTWLPIFTEGGGMGYLNEPSFGYLIGFIPGAWCCGWLAFKRPLSLESLAFSCICGLAIIHLTGIAYLLLAYNVGWIQSDIPILSALFYYTLKPLPSQLAIVCAATLSAYGLRQIMFY